MKCIHCSSLIHITTVVGSNPPKKQWIHTFSGTGYCNPYHRQTDTGTTAEPLKDENGDLVTEPELELVPEIKSLDTKPNSNTKKGKKKNADH